MSKTSCQPHILRAGEKQSAQIILLSFSKYSRHIGLVKRDTQLRAAAGVDGWWLRNCGHMIHNEVTN